MIKYGLRNIHDYFPRENPRGPIVVCYGDSWFWYPFPHCGNLMSRFSAMTQNNAAVDWFVIGQNGLELRSTASYNREFYNLMADRTYNPYIEAVCLSLGGNDMSSSKDLAKILHTPAIETTNPADYIEPDELELWTRDIKKHLLEIVDIVYGVCPVLIHTYDYPIPNGKGILWTKAWLKPALDRARVPKDDDLRNQVLSVIVGAFRSTMYDAKKESYGALEVVDTVGTLSEKHWSNELHPNFQGFNELGLKWYWKMREFGVNLPFKDGGDVTAEFIIDEILHEERDGWKKL